MGVYTDGSCSIAAGIASGTYTTTQTGTGVDTRGYEYAVVVLNAGTFTADETLTLKVQTSDASGSGYADVTGAAFAQITTSNDAAVYYGVVRLHGSARYLRLVGTHTGSGNAVYGADIVLLGKGRTADDDAAAFQVDA